MIRHFFKTIAILSILVKAHQQHDAAVRTERCSKKFKKVVAEKGVDKLFITFKEKTVPMPFQENNKLVNLKPN